MSVQSESDLESLLTDENIQRAVDYFNHFNYSHSQNVREIASRFLECVMQNRGSPLSNALLIHEVIELQEIETLGYNPEPSASELSVLLRGLNINESQDYSRNLSLYLRALYPRTHPAAVRKTDDFFVSIAGDIPKDVVIALNPYTSLDELRQVYSYDLFRRVSQLKSGGHLENGYDFFKILLENTPNFKEQIGENLEQKMDYFRRATFM